MSIWVELMTKLNVGRHVKNEQMRVNLSAPTKLASTQSHLTFTSHPLHLSDLSVLPLSTSLERVNSV
jgi:hypothetical protein